MTFEQRSHGDNFDIISKEASEIVSQIYAQYLYELYCGDEDTDKDTDKDEDEDRDEDDDNDDDRDDDESEEQEDEEVLLIQWK